MNFVGIIPQDLAIGALWPSIVTLIERSLPRGRGEYTLDDIRAGIAAGEMFALGVVTGPCEIQFVATCALVVTPQKRILYVQHGAGRGGAKALDALKAAARTLEADWIETRCRASVAKLYERLGFDCDYRVPILEIDR